MAGVCRRISFRPLGGSGGGCQVGGDETDGTNGSVGNRRGLGWRLDGGVGSGEEVVSFVWARRSRPSGQTELMHRAQ